MVAALRNGMKTAVVTTTIRIPKNLEGYTAQFAKYGHKDVEFIVIGDLKSPNGLQSYLDDLKARTGFPIEHWDVERQKIWLKAFPKLDRILPYNSIQRRNLGYLLAVVGGADCIISIDDDNYVTEVDFLGAHEIVGTEASLPMVASSTGWFNTPSLLETSPQRPLYHRGFPICMRGVQENLRPSVGRGRVVVNVGLWRGVPDADAISHLDYPVNVIGFREDFPGRVAIASGTQIAFNSQNTAFHRDLLPCMFLIPMGDYIGNFKIGRYDDIWMSFFVKAIADHMGDLVCVGQPLVNQERNEHDLMDDLIQEIPGMRITNKLVNSLRRVHLKGRDYFSCYMTLIEELRRSLVEDNYTSEERCYFILVLDRMKIWAEACVEL